MWSTVNSVYSYYWTFQHRNGFQKYSYHSFWVSASMITWMFMHWMSHCIAGSEWVLCSQHPRNVESREGTCFMYPQHTWPCLSVNWHVLRWWSSAVLDKIASKIALKRLEHYWKVEWSFNSEFYRNPKHWTWHRIWKRASSREQGLKL